MAADLSNFITFIIDLLSDDQRITKLQSGNLQSLNDSKLSQCAIWSGEHWVEPVDPNGGLKVRMMACTCIVKKNPAFIGGSKIANVVNQPDNNDCLTWTEEVKPIGWGNWIQTILANEFHDDLFGHTQNAARKKLYTSVKWDSSYQSTTHCELQMSYHTLSAPRLIIVGQGNNVSSMKGNSIQKSALCNIRRQMRTLYHAVLLFNKRLKVGPGTLALDCSSRVRPPLQKTWTSTTDALPWWWNSCAALPWFLALI